MSALNEYQWYTDDALYALDSKMDANKDRMKKGMSEFSKQMEKQVTSDLIDDFVNELSNMDALGKPMLQPLSELQRGMLTCVIGDRVHRYAQAVEAAMSKFNKI